MKNEQLLSASRSFFIDVQGTLIDDKNRLPIDGAIEFIDKLNKKNIPYVVITNNTKYKSEDFLKSLQELGFDIKEQSYLDPFTLLTSTLRKKKVAAFGQDNFLKVLQEIGYEVDLNMPEALVVSIKKEYTNEDYAKMIEIAMSNVEIIAMHETSLYAKEGKRYPGVGAIMKMIQFAVNKEYDVVGKPSKRFYEAGKNLINSSTHQLINFNEITIISDDMTGDLIGAKRLGMKTIFVLSGKIKDANEIIPTLKNEDKPDLICKNMAEVLREIQI